MSSRPLVHALIEVPLQSLAGCRGHTAPHCTHKKSDIVQKAQLIAMPAELKAMCQISILTLLHCHGMLQMVIIGPAATREVLLKLSFVGKQACAFSSYCDLHRVNSTNENTVEVHFQRNHITQNAEATAMTHGLRRINACVSKPKVHLSSFCSCSTTTAGSRELQRRYITSCSPIPPPHH